MFIEQGSAVHLPGDPHGFNPGQRMLLAEALDRAIRRQPPLFGILLGP